MSTAAADAMAEGRGRVEYLTLAHGYDHLIPVADEDKGRRPDSGATLRHHHQRVGSRLAHSASSCSLVVSPTSQALRGLLTVPGHAQLVVVLPGVAVDGVDIRIIR